MEALETLRNATRAGLLSTLARSLLHLYTKSLGRPHDHAATLQRGKLHGRSRGRCSRRVLHPGGESHVGHLRRRRRLAKVQRVQRGAVHGVRGHAVGERAARAPRGHESLRPVRGRSHGHVRRHTLNGDAHRRSRRHLCRHVDVRGGHRAPLLLLLLELLLLELHLGGGISALGGGGERGGQSARRRRPRLRLREPSLHQVRGSRLGLGLRRGGWLGRLGRRRGLGVLRLARHVRSGARGSLLSLGLLLRRRLLGRVLRDGRRRPRPRKRSLRDERVLERLVRRPSLVRIRLEQAVEEVQERRTLRALLRDLLVGQAAGEPDGLDDIRQFGVLEILLANRRLLARLSLVLVQGHQPVGRVGRTVDPGVLVGALEKLVRVGSLCDHRRRGRAQRLADPRQEVVLRSSGEQGQAQEQLRGDAPETPHVDRHTVRRPEDHLGGPVEPGLDVLVHGSVLEARAAKVDELDLTRVQ
mmetsp:Transcript_8113/g.36919  ORF Transcript_8113/g.36919 Transcript_8113/m.36919 type:complete len:471 (+) Transcript_8113:945-2357(+)